MDKIKKKHVGAPLGNQYAVGNNGGRPNKYQNVEELQVLIDKYFADCWEKRIIKDNKGNVLFDADGQPLFESVQVKPYTISGLAVALDTTRALLLDYQDKAEFSYAITHAKSRIQAYAEETLYTIKNPAGVMFSLKNNYKWKDKHEIEQSITIDTAGAISAARERAKLLRDE